MSSLGAVRRGTYGGRIYRAPGAVETLPENLSTAWNRDIDSAFEDALSEFMAPRGYPPADRAGRFVSSRPIDGHEVRLKWRPAPRQLVACLGRRRARAICDSEHIFSFDNAPDNTLAGGREWHVECCEFKILSRYDENMGRLRPKRVEITTELPTYWVCLARESPSMVLELARQVLEDEEVD